MARGARPQNERRCPMTDRVTSSCLLPAAARLRGRAIPVRAAGRSGGAHRRAGLTGAAQWKGSWP